MTGPLRGIARVPGDKSISHRALILAALAVGKSRIENLCQGQDVLATIAALQAMGVRIDRQADGSWSVLGVGVGGLLQPEQPFGLGNSGTSARLLMGLVASHPVSATFTGDASLSRRPMDRVAEPLRRIGATIDGGYLPLTVTGITPALPRRNAMAAPSAQVKSALLLAGLNIPGVTEVVEAAPTRDHLERMLPLFGAEIECDGELIRLRGEAELRPTHVRIPGDPSAAAFLTLAAMIVPGSEVRIESVGINPLRMGFYEVLSEMGADLSITGEREISGEPVGDLTVRHSGLSGCEVPPEMAPRMIDEYPALFIAAAFARGTTRVNGVAELRIKESDRIAAMAEGLRAIGAWVEESEDGLTVHGSGGEPLRGAATVASRLDHRVAMSFAAAGLHCAEPVGVDDMSPVETSFPGFQSTLNTLSAV
jgi:3-phosphoshikimate 1-carboxyvinyltransferase